MKNQDKLNQETLKKLLSYNEETGIFRWLDTVDHQLRGKNAGYLHSRYWAIKVNGSPYLAHRLAWLYVYGYWPDRVDIWTEIAYIIGFQICEKLRIRKTSIIQSLKGCPIVVYEGHISVAALIFGIHTLE